jgi:hypothetical protein
MKATHRPDRLLFATIFVMTIGTSANAYIDGGSGSYLLQVAIAGIVGGLFAAKTYWANLKMLVGAKLKPQTAPAVAHPTQNKRSAR